jgi:hypothetical protein
MQHGSLFYSRVIKFENSDMMDGQSRRDAHLITAYYTIYYFILTLQVTAVKKWSKS